MQMATVSTIKIIKHTDIDFQKWDYAMAKACNSLVYGYSWYLNIVSPEWMGIVLNDYEAVMPITVHKKWGISYVSQPFCTQQLGLFASNEATIQSHLPEVITLLKAKFRYISIQLNYLNKLQNTNTLKNNFELSLAKPYAALYQHYSHGLKDNLRKAKKQAYAVEPTTHYQVIIDFFIQEKGAAYTHIKAEHYAILSEICRQAQAKNLLTCTLIRDQHQQIVATALFIEHAQRIIFLTVKAKNTVPFLLSSTIILQQMPRSQLFLISRALLILIWLNSTKGLVPITSHIRASITTIYLGQLACLKNNYQPIGDVITTPIKPIHHVENINY
ncbi:MAG: hypothetical protein RL711_141 [Bacteroidota bacterium]